MKFFKKLLAISLTLFTITAAFGACGKSERDITVYMPDGAPALAFAGLMAEDKPDDGVSYKVVDATQITSKISANKMADNADLCVLPVNAASKRLGNGDKYQMLGLVTQGNLYFITKKNVADVDELSELTGKTVGVAQIANVPGLTLKAALNKAGVAWTELKNGVTAAEDVVNLKGIEVGTIDGSLDYYLVAEPLVTTRTYNGEFRVAGDLQVLYNGKDSENVGYPQAVLVAKRAFLEKNRAWTEQFLEKLIASNEWVKTAEVNDIYVSIVCHFEDPTHKPTFNGGTLTKDCVARCGISFAYAKDCSARVDAFLAEYVAINPNMASAVSQDFYWLG